MRRLFLFVALLMVLLGGAAALYRLTARVPEAAAPWTRASAMPTARSEMPAAVLDGKVYVPGGLGSLGRTLDTFEVYDPATDRWDSLAPLPVGVHHTGVAAAAGKVYVMGGYRDLGFAADNPQVWAYHPSGDTWERVGDMPSPRAAHALVTVDELIYVIGGVGPEAQALWAYDPVEDLWEQDLAPLPTAREHLAAVALDGRIYAIAGRWAGEGNLGTLEVYDPETDSWSRGAELPTPRSGLTAAALNGRIHVGGGEELSSGRTFDSHEVYYPATDSWEEGVPMVAPRHGLASASLDGRWFIIGGATRAGAQTFVSLTDTVDVLELAVP